MDAARGVKGQGRPLYTGPWSNDGTREVEAQRDPDARGKTFCLLLAGPAIRASAKSEPP